MIRPSDDQIFFVDDEPNILEGFRRLLHKDYAVDTAGSVEEALAALEKKGPYAVLVSDLRMPGADGNALLSAAAERWPDMARIMLTGHADIEAAMSAVNEGRVFRFLTKPVADRDLRAALDAGIRQYRSVSVERHLLEETLHGSVRVLTEVLALVNPRAFTRATRVRRYVGHVVKTLRLPDAWQYEVAAMLCQIGCVTLPTEIIDKIYAGQELTAQESDRFFSHPEVGRDLIASIPRLETVAVMIGTQHENVRPGMSLGMDGRAAEAPISSWDAGILGGQILKTCLDFDDLVIHGMPPPIAVEALRAHADEYVPSIVGALEGMAVLEKQTMRPRLVGVNDLHVGMVLDQDLFSNAGRLLVGKGQEVTAPVLNRLRNFAVRPGIQEPFRVLAPTLLSDNSAGETR